MRLQLVSIAVLILFNRVDTHAQGLNHKFWSSSSKHVEHAKSSENCSPVEYDHLENIDSSPEDEYRVTIVADGDEVRFHALDFPNIGNIHHWKFIRVTGPNAPDTVIYTGDVVALHFFKLSSAAQELYDEYRVLFYEETDLSELVLLEEDVVFVTPKRLGEEEPFHYGFDLDDIPASSTSDVHGKLPVTRYPLFSGNGNNRSDKGSLIEKINTECIYPSYFSNEDIEGPGYEPRDGNGCVHIFNPSKNQSQVLNSSELLAPCGIDSLVEFYDYCLDTCNVWSQSVSPDIHPSYKNTLTAKSQLNVYPNHGLEEDYFYAFSIKIPHDFNEENLIDPEDGSIGSERWHVLAEFHQSTWPYNKVQFPTQCQSSVQLLYLGDGLIGIQYGLTDYNRCAFGPYKILKGEWFDVVFRIRWSQVKEVDKGWEDDLGLFEFWLNGRDGYSKQCLIPATDFYRNNRRLGSNLDNIGFFASSEDSKTLYGPNLENVNPPYISLKTMRGSSDGGTQGFDFESHAFFDELRIGKSFEEVSLPFIKKIDDEESICHDFTKKATSKMKSELEQFTFQVYPNPVLSEECILSFSNKIKDEPVNIRVHNLLGKKVFTVSEFLDVYLTLNTAGWAAGTYIVTCTSGSLTKTEKILIIH